MLNASLSSQLDPKELNQAVKSRSNPAVSPEDIEALRRQCAALRSRVAAEGLHFEGKDNLHNWLHLQWIEEGLAKLVSDVDRERSTRN